MSLEWPVAPTGGLDQSSLSLSQEDTNDEHLENAHLGPAHLRWRRDALQQPELQRVELNRNTCVHIPDDGLRRATQGKTHLLHSTYQEQRHHLSSRNSWEG